MIYDLSLMLPSTKLSAWHACAAVTVCENASEASWFLLVVGMQRLLGLVLLQGSTGRWTDSMGPPWRQQGEGRELVPSKEASGRILLRGSP